MGTPRIELGNFDAVRDYGRSRSNYKMQVLSPIVVGVDVTIEKFQSRFTIHIRSQSTLANLVKQLNRSIYMGANPDKIIRGHVINYTLS